MSILDKIPMLAFVDAEELKMSFHTHDGTWKRLYALLRTNYGADTVYLVSSDALRDSVFCTYVARLGFCVVERFEIARTLQLQHRVEDVDTILYALTKFTASHKAFVISSDGEFYCLVSYEELRAKSAQKRLQTIVHAHTSMFASWLVIIKHALGM